jgi:metal-sulfur cluster biosynthetic enzyme
MIRAIDVQEDKIDITMILTSPMCPMASMMMQQVQQRASEITTKSVEVHLGQEFWNPDMMEPDARDTLGI